MIPGHSLLCSVLQMRPEIAFDFTKLLSFNLHCSLMQALYASKSLIFAPDLALSSG
jgi:hypothetical protein